MSSHGRPWFRMAIAALLGGLLGFIVPRLPVASAARAKAAKTDCQCPTIRCTNSDDMLTLSADCYVHCEEGTVPACQCGRCQEDSGGLDHPNRCQCKPAK